jgi:hypothetical protein
MAAFVKLLTMACHFIGGGSTRGPPSYNYPHPKCMQVNRRNIISVVKVTITTPFLYNRFKIFSKIMTEGQEVTERTNSPTFC